MQDVEILSVKLVFTFSRGSPCTTTTTTTTATTTTTTTITTTTTTTTTTNNNNNNSAGLETCTTEILPYHYRSAF